MRIGIMLRAFQEKGSIGVYTRNIVTELVQRNQSDEYILFHNEPASMGRFADYPHVRERLVKGANKAAWDQVAIPAACRRERLDVLFHPKFTIPLLAPCPAVMTVHGADWFMPEQARYYKPLDIAYMRAAMPLYFKKCAAVISVSQLTTDNFNQVLGLPPGKVRTIYLAPARHFRRIADHQTLAAVRTRYHLPARFILTLSKTTGGDRKNLARIFRAYAAYHRSVPEPVSLVVGGKDCHLFRDQYRLPIDGYGQDILFPGWLEQADLPAIYSLASLYLYPSNLEAFPIPISEAMACGTPIVTSNVNGLREIAGDAAMLVDPRNTEAVAAAIYQVLADPDLCRRLSARGLARSRRYSWDNCAGKTLTILKEAACN